MTITKEQNNNTVVIKIEGRLDTVTAPELEKEIKELPMEANEFIFDLKDLAYIASAGLRVMLSAQKMVNKVPNGNMKLVNVSETVYEVFEITGFTDIMTVEK